MEVKVSFDWFKFTTDQVLYNEFYYSDNTDVKEILKRGENELILKEVVETLNHRSKLFTLYEMNRGKCARGYTYGLAIDEGVSVSLLGSKNDNDKPTTLFELTGKGCYHYSKNQDYIKCWYKLFDLALRNNMKFTRLDIAFDLIGVDDVSDFIQWLLVKIKDGYCRTRWKENYDSEITSPNDGYTMYLGSPSSSSRIRIYNKNSEKISKDKNAFIDNDNYWRIEMQLTSNSNNDREIYNFVSSYIYFFKDYVENFYDNKNGYNDFKLFLTDYLNKYIEVRLKDDERISRCSVDPRWQEFIGELEKNMTFEPGDKNRRSTVIIKKDWLERSVFKAMAQVFICYGDKYFCNFLKVNLSAAMDDFKDIDKIQIANYFNENGLVSDFIKNDMVSSIKFKEMVDEFKEKKVFKVDKR